MDSDSDGEGKGGDVPRPAKASKIRMLPSVGVPDAAIVVKWLLPWIIEQLDKQNGDEPEPTGNSDQ